MKAIVQNLGNIKIDSLNVRAPQGERVPAPPFAKSESGINLPKPHTAHQVISALDILLTDLDTHYERAEVIAFLLCAYPRSIQSQVNGILKYWKQSFFIADEHFNKC